MSIPVVMPYVHLHYALVLLLCDFIAQSAPFIIVSLRHNKCEMYSIKTIKIISTDLRSFVDTELRIWPCTEQLRNDKAIKRVFYEVNRPAPATRRSVKVHSGDEVDKKSEKPLSAS